MPASPSTPPRRRRAAIRFFCLTLLWLASLPGSAGAERYTRVSTLAALEATLAACDQPSCIRLVYFWSVSMPLSQLGAAEIAAAAEELGVPLVVAPGETLKTAGDGADPARFARRFIDSGATVHFPSVVIAENDTPRGSAVVGYRRAHGYRDLLAPRLGAVAAGESLPAAPLGPTPGSLVPAGPADELSGTGLRIVWRRAMKPVPGAFYRHVHGTPYIAYDQGRDVYLRDVASGERLHAPGFVDFVPTPDSRLFVTPGEDRSGLEFYSASEVIRRGRMEASSTVETVFKDTEMTDQYPSVGILDSSGPDTRYRVLTSKFEGLAFRDYEARWRGLDDVVVTPVSPKRTLCPGRSLSTPMISRDGREVAARDERTGTTWIFRVRDQGGRCEPVRDLGTQTGKVSFGADGNFIAYGAPDGYGRSYTYVLDRGTGKTIRIPDSRSQGLIIPEMIERGRVLFLAVEEKQQKAGVVRTSEFRIACCIDK